MKYAFMSFSAPNLGLGDLLGLAKTYGYDGIEPRTGSNHGHGIELETSAAERTAIRRQVHDSGVALCCLAVGCKYADPETAGDNVEVTRRSIALAAEVGAPRLRAFGGAVPVGISREQAIDSVVRSLAAVAAEALDHGVTICIETHDDWTDPAHVVKVMQQVNHPAIAVNWDYQHTTRQAKKTVDQAFITLKPWIRHVHFHDGENRADKLVFKPIGEGDYDNRRVVELLMEAGYDGFLSGEWIGWEPYDQHLPRELAAIRRFER